MCSRFHLSLYTIRKLKHVPESFQEGDIRPGDLAPVLCRDGEGLSVQMMRWGFHLGNGDGLVFNARAESVLQKPAFSDGFLNRRLIVPASWFYEWNRAKEKSRFEKERPDEFLYFAGIWRQEEDGSHFVILTAAANRTMKPVHDRMPLILDKDEPESWCKTTKDAEALLKKVPGELKRSTEYEQLSLF